MKLTIKPQYTTLSSLTAVYKTQRFLSVTGGFLSFDLFLSKMAECLIENDFLVKVKNYKNAECFCLGLKGLKFYFVLKSSDIIFTHFESSDAFIRRGDSRFLELLKENELEINLSDIKDSPTPSSDLKKLYRLSYSDFVHFPLLDDNQSRIISTEDENMLVQGVAGSGKTNLCIDKIIYSAARGYAGKVLYSTFSRGLLADTSLRVKEFTKQIKWVTSALTNKEKTKILGGDRVEAVEKRLGIKLNISDDKLIFKLEQMADYLANKVDYKLIEDLYAGAFGGSVNMADESYFIKSYIPSIKNHQLTSRLAKIHYLSHEVIYKEIFGLITGACDSDNPQKLLTLIDYTNIRQNSFSKEECEIIFTLASDYVAHLQKNSLFDNNTISRELLELKDDLEKYSLVVLDEVQDFTQVNLVLFKSITIKVFCVGDALQMINASYFSFSYLKRLLYQKDLSSTAELVSNYRNTKKIADISTSLANLNSKWFGVHSFVLTPKALDDYTKSDAVFVNGGEFLQTLSKNAFNNYTIVVASQKQKLELRQKFPRPEILTVSEIKGLERDTIILYNLTASNITRFKNLERAKISRKSADENSVYRYYFNLLYVGVSRARQKLFVYENEKVDIFSEFFKNNFDSFEFNKAVSQLLLDADKLEAEQDELIDRVKQFIALSQYDNARFSAKNIVLSSERQAQLNRIDVAEEFISKGLNKEAGIKFLQLAMYLDAKEQFTLSGDTPLEELADSCLGSNSNLGLEVLNSFVELSTNADVRKIILNLVKQDFAAMQESSKAVFDKLREIKTS